MKADIVDVAAILALPDRWLEALTTSAGSLIEAVPVRSGSAGSASIAQAPYL